MTNIFLLIIAALIIAFIWLIWLRQSLLNTLQVSEQKRQILQLDLNKRRDVVPYLLESFRAAQEPNDAWHKILNQRKEFNQSSTLEKEWEFEQNLAHFMRDTHIKTQNFLEAKKAIQDLTDLVEKEKLELEAATQTFTEKQKQFPYSMASAIFGLRA